MNVRSDEQLDGSIGDTDSLEDGVQVVRDETVSGPLREPGDGKDDPQALAVPGSGKDRLPANVLGD